MPFYLVYTSLPRIEMSKSTLDEITRISIRNNRKKGITGILLGIESRYLQFLEGDEEEVLQLFERIKQDPRHYELNKWVQGHSDERIFSDWSMASWLLTNEELKNIKALNEIRQLLKDPQQENYASGRFLEMIKNLMESWIAHGEERFPRSNHD